jgi:alkaline phosphatase D
LDNQGDPWSNSVLLWTRAYPTGGQPDQSVPVCVKYGVFKNAALTGKPVASGAAFTSWDVDFTVKVEADGLKPDAKYWYQFSDCANPSTKSPIGATRTFADDSTPANQVNGGAPLKFAVFSCSNYPFGFFNSYGFAAKNLSADVFVHLGDYVSIHRYLWHSAFLIKFRHRSMNTRMGIVRPIWLYAFEILLTFLALRFHRW